MQGMHLLFQLGPDLMPDLSFHLPNAQSLLQACDISCTDSHKAFMSIQHQVSFFDDFLKVKMHPDMQ